MNRILKFLILCVAVISVIFIFQKMPGNESSVIKLKNSNMESVLKFKGLKDARDFTIDDSGNFYIAYNNRIQIIEKNGKSYDMFKNFDLNISSLCFYENKLFYCSNTKIYCFDIANNKNIELISGLPNLGDYKESILKIKGSSLYISLGAATNSGVVGDDNAWVSSLPFFHDISPTMITLKGINFGLDKTGAFQSYKTKSMNGQIISGHFPGTASLIIYNINTGTSDTFAYGIRNIKGMDFTSDGKLLASVGGMENRGLRPIIGDSDYIYEINKGIWYGWPDYSGGDPVNSPRFKGKNGKQVSFVLENHPNTNPPAPIYQSGSAAELGEVAVDTKGAIGDKNTVYFYKKGSVFSLDKKGVLKEEFILPIKSIGCKMMFSNNQFFVLDSTGNIFLIKSKNFN